MKLFSLEGNTQRLDGGAMFGNAPKALWAKWITADAENRIALACRSLLFENEQGKRILFETGIGAFFEPHLKKRFGVVESNHVLLESLAQHNLSHREIDAVVLSHLHFDHAGGLLSSYDEGPLQLLFPNAHYFVSQTQWERACNPHSRDRVSYIPLLQDLLQKSGRLVLVNESDKSIATKLSSRLTFRFSNGHTPGLLLSEILLDDGPLVFASDLIPGAAWVNVPISMGYDRFPEQLIDEKRALLEDLLPRQGKLFFTHETDFAVGAVRKDEKGKFSCEPLAIATLA